MLLVLPKKRGQANAMPLEGGNQGDKAVLAAFSGQIEPTVGSTSGDR